MTEWLRRRETVVRVLTVKTIRRCRSSLKQTVEVNRRMIKRMRVIIKMIVRMIM